MSKMKPNQNNLPIPKRMQHLKVWKGFPVPYVTMMDKNKEPDFRVIDHVRHKLCLHNKLCGICGKEFGNEWLCFIGGNLCVQNRLFYDPAMHSECAYYAAQTCPYLLNEHRDYAKNTSKTEKHGDVAAVIHVPQNRPEQMAVYKCKSYQVVQTSEGQYLAKVPKKPRILDWDAMPPTNLEL